MKLIYVRYINYMVKCLQLEQITRIHTHRYTVVQMQTNINVYDVQGLSLCAVLSIAT